MKDDRGLQCPEVAASMNSADVRVPPIRIYRSHEAEPHQ
jgi:hypothetical protein